MKKNNKYQKPEFKRKKIKLNFFYTIDKFNQGKLIACATSVCGFTCPWSCLNCCP
jgi:hypothetical protein